MWFLMKERFDPRNKGADRANAIPLKSKSPNPSLYMNQIPKMETQVATMVLGEGIILKKIPLKAAANRGDKAMSTKVFAAPALCTPKVKPTPPKPHIKPLMMEGSPPEVRIEQDFLLFVTKNIAELEIQVKKAR